MARRSWFIAALVLALLFVTSDCLRGPATNADVSPSTSSRARGGSRYSLKVEETPETSPVPFTSQTRPSRRGRPAVTPSGRADDKNETTTPRSRRNRDGNNEVNRIAKVITEIPNSVRRHSSSRQPVENDLAKAASNDRRYLPENRERRGRKLDQEVPLEAPNEGLKVVSRRHRGRTSSEETTTISSRSRGTGRNQMRDSSESRKPSARRITERSTEKQASTKEGYTPRTLGRRVTERSSRRRVPVPSNSDHGNLKNIPSSVENTTPLTSQTNSGEFLAPTKPLRRGPSKFSLFTSDEFNSFDPLKNILNEMKSDTATLSLTPRPKPRTQGRSGQDSKKPQNSNATGSTPKLPSKEKFEKRFKNRPELAKPRPPKIEVNTLKPKVTVKVDKVRSSKGVIQIGGKAPGKLDKARSSTQESSLETTTQFSAPLSAVTTPFADLLDLVIAGAASKSVSKEVSSTVYPVFIPAFAPSEEPAAHHKHGRQAPNDPAVSAAEPIRDDFFNYGLGFRGRKPYVESPVVVAQTIPIDGNPGWTLKRRPHGLANGKPGRVNASVATNAMTSTGPRREPIASLILKLDREITPDDNYPPAFKAKLAELSRSDQSEPGTSSRVGEFFSSAMKIWSFVQPMISRMGSYFHINNPTDLQYPK